MRAFKWMIACLLACAGCGSDPMNTQQDMSPDQSASIGCYALCQHYAMCYHSAHPEFVGGPMELAPCLTACGGETSDALAKLESCYSNDCFLFLACGTTAGLSLMPAPKPPMDGGMGDGGRPDGGSPDGGGTVDMSMPDLSMPDLMSLPDLTDVDLTPID